VGIRQKINENPGITTAATAGIIAVAIGVIVWQGCGGTGGGDTIAVATKAFYTIDDGKTLFVDDINKIPPYQKDGKTAVKANVFSCDDGKNRFVGYLEMYTPQDKAMLEKAAQQQPGGQPVYLPYTGQALVKKPGVGKWIPLSPNTTQEYAAVVQVKCPDGSTDNLIRVFPDE
jgi:hypothetical protein